MNLREQMTKRLMGTGLDLGALHRPMIKHDGMRVIYVDRLPVSELKKHYPELSEFPLVEADIIDDAQTLSTIEDGKYDFVIASHVIEHMSCTIGALQNWLRVLRSGGQLYLVVPDKRYIFDRHRLLTTLQHLVTDHDAYPEERRAIDFVHYLEYSELVDGQQDAAILAHALKLTQDGYSIHFHTFTPESFHELLIYFMRNVEDIVIETGPRVDSEDKHEFHFLVRKL